jgi:hypothetical protein
MSTINPVPVQTAAPLAERSQPPAPAAADPAELMAMLLDGAALDGVIKGDELQNAVTRMADAFGEDTANQAALEVADSFAPMMDAQAQALLQGFKPKPNPQGGDPKAALDAVMQSLSMGVSNDGNVSAEELRAALFEAAQKFGVEATRATLAQANVFTPYMNEAAQAQMTVLSGKKAEPATPAPVTTQPKPTTPAPVKPNDKPQAMHIHSMLKLSVDGKPMTVPANIGIDPKLFVDRSLEKFGTHHGPAPVHTHDDSGKLHIESSEPRDFTLGEFLRIWGGLPKGQVSVTADGKKVTDYENLVLKDGLQLAIDIRTK